MLKSQEHTSSQPLALIKWLAFMSKIIRFLIDLGSAGRGLYLHLDGWPLDIFFSTVLNTKRLAISTRKAGAFKFISSLQMHFFESLTFFVPIPYFYLSKVALKFAEPQGSMQLTGPTRRSLHKDLCLCNGAVLPLLPTCPWCPQIGSGAVKTTPRKAHGWGRGGMLAPGKQKDMHWLILPCLSVSL